MLEEVGLVEGLDEGLDDEVLFFNEAVERFLDEVAHACLLDRPPLS